jgi:hypothetical protein
MAEPNIFPLMFNHVALPPQLPGKHDSNAEIEKLNRELVERLLNLWTTQDRYELLIEVSNSI